MTVYTGKDYGEWWVAPSGLHISTPFWACPASASVDHPSMSARCYCRKTHGICPGGICRYLMTTIPGAWQYPLWAGGWLRRWGSQVQSLMSHRIPRNHSCLDPWATHSAKATSSLALSAIGFSREIADRHSRIIWEQFLWLGVQLAVVIDCSLKNM